MIPYSRYPQTARDTSQRLIRPRRNFHHPDFRSHWCFARSLAEKTFSSRSLRLTKRRPSGESPPVIRRNETLEIKADVKALVASSAASPLILCNKSLNCPGGAVRQDNFPIREDQTVQMPQWHSMANCDAERMAGVWLDMAWIFPLAGHGSFPSNSNSISPIVLAARINLETSSRTA